MITEKADRQQMLQVIWMQQWWWKERVTTREPSRSTSGLCLILTFCSVEDDWKRPYF